MKCYLIQGPGAKRYAGTQADARTMREEVMAITGAQKKDVSIEDADIPAPKNEQLAFINKLCAELDNIGE